MITAIGMYHRSREAAFNFRLKALKAAQEGRGMLAIELTRRAQGADRLAEDWQQQIPDWQWAAWHESKEE